MKQYTLSFAQSIEHRPEHPERTAKKSLEFDVLYQVWPNRKSMAKSIRMQQRSSKTNIWRAVERLTDNEGY